ncbi:MAG TPA: alpha/beta fold hydrolase [Usitatibacter sp.]|nr:alpha/beta fold hydrolase [Usitatibacter sp.]
MTLPNVLLLPGLLEDADAFEELIGGTRDIAVSIVADMTRADTISGLAQNALRQAPEGPLFVAGHSMGGYVALEIVRQAPERVAKLALLNTHARPDTPESTENRRRLMALADHDFEAVVNTLMPRLMTEEHLKDPVLTGIVAGMAHGVGKEAFKRQEKAIIERIDSRPHLEAIRCPTRVVAARNDAIMPVEILAEMAGAIPGAKLDVVEDCGHMASIERPAELTGIMRDWIQGG